MASGNYRDQPVESPPQTPLRSDVPPRTRATRKIGEDNRPSGRVTKVIEPETPTERAAKPQRTVPARKAVAVQEPSHADFANASGASSAKSARRKPSHSDFANASPGVSDAKSARRKPSHSDFANASPGVSDAKSARRKPDLTEPPLRYQYAPEEPHPLTQHRSWLPRLLLTVVCVVIGALVLAIAGMYVRQPPGGQVNYYPQGQSFPIQLGGSYQAFQIWNNSTGPLPSQTPLPKNPGPYSVLGKPTISVQLINAVLASYHSPTAGMGQSLYDLGVKYGIDPVYPLAFFMHESLFGTTGEARVTLSLGNSRCIPDRACVDQDRGGYARMNSWQDGFEQWYKLIRNLYIAQWGRVTVDQIIPKYAPNSDGNNEKEYIASLKHEVDVWRAGGIRP